MEIWTHNIRIDRQIEQHSDIVDPKVNGHRACHRQIEQHSDIVNPKVNGHRACDRTDSWTHLDLKFEETVLLGQPFKANKEQQDWPFALMSDKLFSKKHNFVKTNAII